MFYFAHVAHQIRESLRRRRKPTTSDQAFVGNDSGRRSRYGHRR
ncbi:hypothetical protein HanXRQr2_Chr03g0138061 [Helianthus annuus]|uniref:Uncharacterized protein n=1 Tax=Helianthus annuus TaxID=4232 RepID=A0A9K3JKJ8_HELAN|nr:hypothetical protein HanXRQr2_Chr03g0138061 [Helianthus annuus]KAJ0946026.1 hypothetical protein HanPSC8_Chr03g0134641 [Helianthus annuus]